MKGNCQHRIYCQCIDTKTRRLHKKYRGRLITATRNNINKTSINRIEITRKQKWENCWDISRKKNKQTFFRENWDMAKKVKPLKRK